ncbi:MAG: thiamine pyrophosphate-dependent enzyme [Alphaproteobacteria bacterium]
MDTPWYRIEATEADWKAEDPVALSRMLEDLLVIRRFEERILDLFKAGCVHGPAHSSIGQEGGAVGAMSVLTSADKINATHRAHHQFLAKFLNHVAPEGRDPRRDELTDGINDVIYRSMAEIMGLKPGYCGGRGGSMHMRWDEAGVLGTNAIVGGNPPQAAGYALAEKLRKSDNLTVTFFGDGATAQGSVYEAMNMAALYDLPIVFFIENNLYGVSTHVRETTRETRLSARGLGLAIPSAEVDGMNTLSVRKAMQWARQQIREKAGPVVVEAKTYRYFHQHGPMKGSAFGYREKDEEQSWGDRDPLKSFADTLQSLGIIDKATLDAMQARIKASVDAASGRLTETEPGSNLLRVVPALWPDPKEADVGIRGDLSELKGKRFMEADEVDPKTAREIKFIEAIPLAQLHAMERDPSVFVLGEDVHRLKGGTVGATKGILEAFPERLIGTPICENGFSGLALGAAINGMRPVVEFMYADFVLVAADQLFNQIAKVRHMFGGTQPAHLIVRVRVAGGHGYGSQHSMDPSGLFALYPGWRVVAPTTPFDYIGLFNSAVQCDDPVVFIECQTLYQTPGLIPDNDLDFCVPFGKARIARPGAACTVVTCANMVPVSVDAAEKSGIDAEVIDLRTLDPLGLDWETISASVKKTNRLIVVEQTSRGPSLGARIVQEAQEKLFDWLDHEILRVSGSQAAPVVSKVLEKAALANVDDVVAGLHALTGRAAA